MTVVIRAPSASEVFLPLSGLVRVIEGTPRLRFDCMKEWFSRRVRWTAYPLGIAKRWNS